MMFNLQKKGIHLFCPGFWHFISFLTVHFVLFHDRNFFFLPLFLSIVATLLTDVKHSL